MNRLADVFDTDRARLVIYLCAGDPSLDATPDMIVAAAEAGADVIEVGMPFSDPTADGPTIQAASERALGGGATMRGVLDAIGAARARTDVPILLFGYYNPILRYGEAQLVEDAKAAGVDGLLVVDLPPEHAEPLLTPMRAQGLALVPLVAPTSTPARIEAAAAVADAFLYYVSMMGVTGSAGAPLEDAAKRAAGISESIGKPVVVGFGVRTREDVATVAAHAAGVVVGSAVVRAVHEASDPVAAVRAIVSELARGLGARPMDETIRKRVMESAQGAFMLHIAYVGVTNDLLSTLARVGRASAARLADEAKRDPAYVTRWCDAAYAFELLDEVDEDVFALTELGAAFDPGRTPSLFGATVHTMLGAHMAERAAGLMKTGERPGEAVLSERETIIDWFGPMFEGTFAPIFEREVIGAVPVFAEVDARGGLAIDLGCGNGWYLRRLAGRYPRLRGVGLDEIEPNIRDAERRAADEGLADRLSFRIGDLHHFTVDEPADLITMSRALHHVWDEKDNVFRILHEHLRPGGAAVIWEPVWPRSRAELRDPARRGVAFQNLAEHVQGNHFLHPDEIAAELRKAGLVPEVFPILEGREAIVVGRKPA